MPAENSLLYDYIVNHHNEHSMEALRELAKIPLLNYRDEDGISPLARYLEMQDNPDNDIVLLLATNENVNWKVGTTPLISYCLSYGDLRLDVIKRLTTTENIMMTNHRGSTALHCIMHSNFCEEFVEYFIQISDMVNVRDNKGNYPLDMYMQTYVEEPHIVKLLLPTKSEDNQNEAFLRRYMYKQENGWRSDDIQTIRLLSEYANLNAVDDDSMTILHKYISLNIGNLRNNDKVKAKIVKILRTDINIYLYDKDNNNPLMYYLNNSTTHNIQVILLLATNDTIKFTNTAGNNALLCYLRRAKHVNMDILRLLVNSSTVNCKNNNGLTPLHMFLLNESSFDKTFDKMPIIDMLATPRNLVHNKGGITALHLYINSHISDIDVEIVKRLRTEHSLDMVDKMSLRTPLAMYMFHANKIDVDVVKELVTEENILISSEDNGDSPYGWPIFDYKKYYGVPNLWDGDMFASAGFPNYDMECDGSRCNINVLSDEYIESSSEDEKDDPLAPDVFTCEHKEAVMQLLTPKGEFYEIYKNLCRA